jgi:glycosyltransferase involved in cell wall biosynthesis
VQPRRYSVVIAAYNVGTYVDRCLNSLVQKSASLRDRIEILVVDDGSTDDTGERAMHWQRRYPERIRYWRKENGGAASARNLGLDHATGDWVTFVDADDCVDRGYFATVDEFLSSTTDDPCLVCGNVRFYYERSGRVINEHPLRFRFKFGTCVVDVFRSPKFLHLAAAQGFYKRSLIESYQLRFSELVVPIFEDAHFTARYLCHSASRQVAFLPHAHYYYTKRRDQSSLVASAWQKPTRYKELLQHGYLDILNFAHEAFGQVPRYIQNLVLYDLSWMFLRLVDHDAELIKLGADRTENFIGLLRSILEFIDIDTILEFDIAELPDYCKCGIIETLKGIRLAHSLIKVESYASESGCARLSHSFTHDDAESIFVDGARIDPLSEKTQIHTFAGRFFAYQRHLRIHLRSGSNCQVDVGALPSAIGLGRSRVPRVSPREILDQEELVVQQALGDYTPKWVKIWREIASVSATRNKFKGCWLLMDRDVQADDNAEHLYRYLLRKHPEIPAYFVLRRDSHDWRRLRQEGFRLIAFGSFSHKLAFLNCRLLASSHIDGYIVNFLPRKWFGDLISHQFVFLQHGVTQGDISGWINQKYLDCMITAGTPEWESIVTNKSPYRYSKHEVKLTGFPRFDALIEAREPRQRTLLFMPTWRQYIVGDVVGKSNRRSHRPGFSDTQYALNWQRLLNSEALHELASRFGLDLVFFPHANMWPYLPEFGLAPAVKAISHRDGCIQRVLTSAMVLVTDYSSIAFDAALLQRAVLYYQFDKAEFHAGQHIHSGGYFDHARDGFGPCCTDVEQLLDELSQILDAGGIPKPEYFERMRRFFPYRDNKNCERVFDVVTRLLEGKQSI